MSKDQNKAMSLTLLRRGRTFSIFRGEDEGAHPVICKMLTGRVASVDAIRRLENEYEITRGLEHPGLVVARRLLDAGREARLVFDDDQLTSLDLLAETQDLTAHALEIAVQLATVLDYLHSAGIIHRDIKPSNVISDPDLKTIRLIDFCLAIRATELEQEEPGAFAAQGTVAYMAPEQTGRMNRIVDWRADLYSLGVTLYELATGAVPFDSDDPGTLFHLHLTRTPIPPQERNPDIPKVLSDAIMRLIEKNPEDRFQSAGDLKEFLLHGAESGVPVSNVLRLSDKLYGRDVLIAQLRKAGVTCHVPESRLVRFAGQSGVGKSALVLEVFKSGHGRQGYFVEGKFDQLDRTRPYSAFLQAFNALLRSLLSGSAQSVDAWRKRLLDALSPNTKVLLDLLPEFEALVGPQPRVAKLGLNEAQIRMSLVFRRFVKALASQESPLVLFLDDLQWADSASRSLIELLLTDKDIQYLTIVVAYRSNEIGHGHPASLMFSELGQKTELSPAIEIGPLEGEDISNLLADSLSQSHTAVQPLSELIVAKTGGNPFFVRQFLAALHRKGLIAYSLALRRWEWDVALIASEKITDNVADLVIERILDLPLEAQELIELAACCGNEFDLEILALASGRARVQIERLLAPAIAAEIVFPKARGGKPDPASQFRFQHDRVQQAVHAIMPAERRAQIHALLGELLLEHQPESKSDGRLIELTDHLIAGRLFLKDAARGKLSDLVLEAARASKAANAYEAAVYYLDVASDLLGPKAWIKDPETAFSIQLEKAEAAYLQNQTDLADEIVTSLRKRDLPVLDEVRVLGLEILLHTSRLAYRAALRTGLQALRLLGEKLPLQPRLPSVLAELLRTKARLAGRSDNALLRLPRMQDPEKSAAMQILVLLAPPAYFTAPNLLPLIALRMVQLSVRYGNAPHSAYGYVIYGMLHCAILGDAQRGLAYGKLAKQAALDLGAQDIEGRVLMVFAGFIQHWSAPLSDTLPNFLEGAEKAISAGDLEYHGYTRYGHASYALMAGLPLERVSEFLDRHLAAVTDSRHEKTRRIMLMARASVDRMRGVSVDDDQEAFDEKENYSLWSHQNDATSLAYFHKYKLLEALMVGDFREVLDQSEAIERNINGIISMGYQPFYQFYEALALIELSKDASIGSRLKWRARARRIARRLERWAMSAPANFAHRAALLRAELAVLDNKTEKAMALFDAAIGAARRSAARHDIGLMLERTAGFYLARGAEEAGVGYLEDALSAHTIWGAGQWGAELVKRHPDLLASHTMQYDSVGESSVHGSSSSRATQVMDSATLLRAASALSEKTTLGEVVKEVMLALVTNAGAARGALLLVQDDELYVAAECDTAGQVRLWDERTSLDSETLPLALTNYVSRSRKRVVIDDATVDQFFGSDDYILAHAPRSVLCVPLLLKGELNGIVYLENARVRGVFTPDRCQIVELLGAQAAISIENARLYDNLRDSLEKQVELTSAHARFVPHQFLETLGRPSISDIRLGDHVRAEASILFSDIRGFTALVEKMEPEEAIRFINAYLSKMEPAVQAGGGFVDSYVGDAVMAVFDRGPDAALDSAIKMLRGLREWARTRENADTIPIRIGIGIATGDMIFGTIGAANRMKCGVIGDTVNLAARIEGLTKHYNLGLLISQGTYRALTHPEQFHIREVDLVTVVGRVAPVRLFEVFDADPQSLRMQKMGTREAVADGLRLYRAGAVEEASQMFEQCRLKAPDDPLLLMLAERCRRHGDRVKNPEWDGIERIERK